MKPIVFGDEAEVKILNGRASRKVLAYGPDMMAVEVHMKQGGVGVDHSHPHVQISYILAGKFEYHTEQGQVIVRQGDSLYFAGGSVHGSICLEDGVILDVFTPQRSDFL
jgi:quercetin dioxygenase-like cupin family protein